jgi:hypothetical protein
VEEEKGIDSKTKGVKSVEAPAEEKKSELPVEVKDAPVEEK